MWWQKYIGIPFVNRGRTVKGVDCGGLIELAYKFEKNIKIAEFDETYNPRRIREAARGISTVKEASFRRVEGPEPFAVAVFARNNMPYHVAICVDKEHVLHAKDNAHVKLVRLSEMDDYHNLEGFYAAT